MVQLTPEQQAEVERSSEPVPVIDPSTGREYVLVTKERYQKLYEIVDDGELNLEEQRRLLRDAGKSIGWDDPEMDVYDELDPRKAS